MPGQVRRLMHTHTYKYVLEDASVVHEAGDGDAALLRVGRDGLIGAVLFCFVFCYGYE